MGLRGWAKAGVAAAALGLAWGSLVERTSWTLRLVDVPCLPVGAKPIRILHLADLHLAPWQSSKQEWVRSLAGLAPDLVVNTGDVLGHRDAIAAAAYCFDPFRGTPGVFVHGSNDYYGPVLKNPFSYLTGPSKRSGTAKRIDTEALDTVQRLLGWHLLDNTSVRAEVGGRELEIAGVDDPHLRRDRVDAALASGGQGRALRLAITHAPYTRVLDAFVDWNATVIFAGHTHGGQVRIPGLGALVTNCDLPRAQARGLSEWQHEGKRSWLHVSAGLGTAITAPIRFDCLPEASFVTLLPRQ